MRACVQRVSSASVTVDGQIVGQIGRGLLVLLGVAYGDDDTDARLLADKIAQLRVFEDEQERMNLSVQEVQGEVLVVSQFTLLGDCRKGRRPAFTSAAEPTIARALYEQFVAVVATHGIPVATGQFQAMMQVSLVNDGPVTLLLDSKKLF
jgi:D-tyrosyl-tRNA(Tyr) deacylase